MSKTLKIILAIIALIIIIAISFYAYTYYRLKKIGIIPTYNEKENITIRKDFVGSIAENTEGKSLEKIFSDMSKDAGFHIYYPTFIPEDLILDKNKINWTTLQDSTDKVSTLALLKKDALNSEHLPISMFQNYTPDEPQKFTNKIINDLKNKKETSINGTIVYYGEYGNGNNILFPTKDGVDIRIFSVDYDLETLLKIARSLK